MSSERPEMAVYGLVENDRDGETHRLEFITQTRHPEVVWMDGNYEAIVAFPLETMVQYDQSGSYVGPARPSINYGGMRMEFRPPVEEGAEDGR